ncbi:hypothetical protein OG373_40015 [Streptomyces avidinii]|uniref:hypothetical protein n=1 Tax=Streptomyces avidinii TaxID=1895 RepID=UPI0038703A9D|nr:hypothetical protein OG373_40015 [Streptomyces avidinii]
MRIIEGTPQEIVDFERLAGTGSQIAPVVDAAPSPEEAGSETEGATATLSGAAPLAAADHVALMKFIYGRAGDDHERTVQTERFIMRLLAEEKVIVAFGRSSKTLDGLADYLMIRDNGPQRYGAVAYLRPGNGGMTVRLGPDDLESLGLGEHAERHIQPRNVAASDPYKLNCPLADAGAAAVALRLVRAALEAVRSE